MSNSATLAQSDDSKFKRTTPDTTLGLNTFQPRDYCSVDAAAVNLDKERLDKLLAHRSCGLISDRKWGEANLAFGFGVYEVKRWNGDPREVRQQAFEAAAILLDNLEKLSRQPGKPGDMPGGYQTDQSHNTQVFAITSFGNHWHIMVAYKRPRLKHEYAGYPGMSESVYVCGCPLPPWQL